MYKQAPAVSPRVLLKIPYFLTLKRHKMDADIKGCLNQIDRSWRAFEHNGKRMTKDEVKKVLEYGLSKGYVSVSQISDDEIKTTLSCSPTQ